MTIKVITINILGDLSLWDTRRELLVNQLVDLSPDIIAVQEVALPDNPTNWLADQLSQRSKSSDLYQVFLTPKTGSWGEQEGIAILSRYPIKSHESISLGGQCRVAQKIWIEANNEALNVINVHLFWQPGHSDARLGQVRKLIQWMDEPSSTSPVVVCGDFNDLPQSQSIQMMKKYYKSAYNLLYDEEPAFTYPTPLPVSTKFKLKTVLSFVPYIKLGSIKFNRRVTLDYIFINQKVKLYDARLILNEPHSNRPNIYPSDHFGLYAELKAIK